MRSSTKFIMLIAAFLAISVTQAVNLRYSVDDPGHSAEQSYTIDALTNGDCTERLNYT